MPAVSPLSQRKVAYKNLYLNTRIFILAEVQLCAAVRARLKLHISCSALSLHKLPVSEPIMFQVPMPIHRLSKAANGINRAAREKNG